MAMSRRPSGSGPYDFQGPRRAPVRPSYENFQPRTELKEEDGALRLIVYLPGYLQQQISFSKEESTRLIRLSGERSLLNNRRQRFNISHRVQENYNFDEIKPPQFRNGILTIVIPKNMVTLPKEEGTSKPTTLDSFPTPQETNGDLVRPRDVMGEALRPPEPKERALTVMEATGLTAKDRVSTAKDPPPVKPQEEQTRQKTSSSSTSPGPKKGTLTTFEKSQDMDTQKAPTTTTTTPGKDHSANDVVGGGRDKWEVVEGKLVKEINGKAVVDIDHRRFMINAGVAVVVIMALGAHMFSHFVGSSKEC